MLKLWEKKARENTKHSKTKKVPATPNNKSIPGVFIQRRWHSQKAARYNKKISWLHRVTFAEYRNKKKRKGGTGTRQSKSCKLFEQQPDVRD